MVIARYLYITPYLNDNLTIIISGGFEKVQNKYLCGVIQINTPFF